MSTRSARLIAIFSLLSAGLVGCQDTGAAKDDDGAGSTDGGSDGGDGGDGGGPDYEEGCHILDGGQGFAWVNDAIAAASEGSTIELCAEGGVHQEAIVVSKAVDIIGPGADQLVIEAPTNDTPLVIEAANASVSGLGLAGTRSGLIIQPPEGGAAPTNVAVSDVQVVNMPNWGVLVREATGVQLDDITVVGSGYGGLRVELGAEAQLSNSLLQSNLSYGITVEDAALAVATTEVLQTTPNEEAGDDIAINLYAGDGAEVSSTNSTYANAELANVTAETASLQLSGDLIEGSLYGIEIRQSAATVADTTVDGAVGFGVLVDSTDTVTLTGLDILGDLETGYETDPDAWNIIVADDAGNITSWPVAGVGLISFASDLHWSDSVVSGWHHAGALLLTVEDENLTVLDGVEVRETERLGIIAGARNTTQFTPIIEAVDVEISAIEMVDDWGENGACSLVDKTVGFYQNGGRIEWTGGGIADVGGYGIVNSQGVAQLDQLTLDTNACASAINFYGSMRVEGSLFTGAGGDGSTALMAAYIDYGGTSSTLEANDFTGNAVDREYESSYTSGDDEITRVYQDRIGYDIFASESASFSLDGNTFQDGVFAAYFADATVQANNNLVEGYESNGFYLSGSSIEGAGNRFADLTGTALYGSQSSIELEDTEVDTIGVREYSYDTYVNGELTEEDVPTRQTGYALYGYESTVAMDGFEARNTASAAAYFYSTTTSSTELVDVTIDTVNTDPSYSYSGAITLNGYYGTHELYIEGLTASALGGDNAVEVYNFNSDSASGTLDLRIIDASIDTTDDYGLYLYGTTNRVTLSGVDIEGTGDEAIYQYGGTLSLDGVEVATAAGSGMQFTNATVTVTSASSSTENAEYGMVCSGSTTIDDCDSIDLTLNGLGESSSCEAACGDTL